MLLFFDLFLAFIILFLSINALTKPSIFTCIILFISQGLIATLIWVRLGASDVAIAEAAIGAGLTGAMLLAAWHRLQKIENINPKS